jgi:hypothetical protein
LQATSQIDASEAEFVVEKLMSLEPPAITDGLQACIEHVEDGLSLSVDSVNGLGVDGPTQEILLDRLLMGEEKLEVAGNNVSALDRVLQEVKDLSSAVNALVE